MNQPTNVSVEVPTSFLDKFYLWAKNSIVDELLIFAVVLVFIESFAQSRLKTNNFDYKVLMGILMYGFLGYFLHYSYEKFPLSKVNVTWSSMSIIIAVMLGYFLYGESMSKNKLISVVFAMCAVYFMAIS